MDHTIGIHTLGIGKRIDHSAYVILSRSEKVGDLGGIKAKKSIVVDLRRAFEDCAPYPHNPLDGLLGLDSDRHELVVAHHAGVVPEPTAHCPNSHQCWMLSAMSVAPRSGMVKMSLPVRRMVWMPNDTR
jgi:hypothetical protein